VNRTSDICRDLCMVAQSGVFLKGLGKFVSAEWTSQEGYDTKSLLRAQRISHVGWLYSTGNEEESM